MTHFRATTTVVETTYDGQTLLRRWLIVEQVKTWLAILESFEGAEARKNYIVPFLSFAKYNIYFKQKTVPK